MNVVDINSGKKKPSEEGNGEEDDTVYILPCPECEEVQWYIRDDDCVECVECGYLLIV